jgi:exodeoxyribonuclease VII small subunit
MKKSKVSFESAMERLEEIVDKLESGDENLEDSVCLYQEGMDISKYCKQMLDQAEQKITTVDVEK